MVSVSGFQGSGFKVSSFQGFSARALDSRGAFQKGTWLPAAGKLSRRPVKRAPACQ